MSQQQSAENVSIDNILVDTADTQSDTVEPDDVPEEIEPTGDGLDFFGDVVRFDGV